MTHAMFRLTLRLSLLFIFLLALASCGNSDGAPPTVKLTETDSGSSVVLRQGQMLEVSLQENGTTGYLWEIVPGAESILSAQGSSYVATNPDPMLSGGGGVRTFTFMAAASGNAVLRIILRQPWMTNVAPAKTFEAAIAVVN